MKIKDFSYSFNPNFLHLPPGMIGNHSIEIIGFLSLILEYWSKEGKPDEVIVSYKQVTKRLYFSPYKQRTFLTYLKQNNFLDYKHGRFNQIICTLNKEKELI